MPLTTSEFDLARLVIHGIFVKDHIARQGQGQPLAVEDRPVWRETDESVGDCDVVEHAGLEIAYEDIGGPETVKLVVVQCDAGREHRIINNKE